MGAWGSGIFENDDAADWSAELQDEGINAVAQALAALTSGGYLEAPDASRALAAADVVARLRTGGGEVSPYSEAVVAWVEQNRQEPAPALVSAAVAAIQAIRGDQSELRELWEDAGDGPLAEWLAVLSEVETRLTG